jgi:RNA polymerase sigma-70 factor (ECF subfamily)
VPDEAAFAAFLSANEGIIRAYAASLGVPWGSVDEVAHEAFVQYYLGQDRRPEGVEPLAWLKGVARHCAMSWFRSQKKANRWTELSDVLDAEAETEEDQTDTASPSAVPALKLCMQALPEKSRQVLDWYYFSELATEAIAERLRQTPAAVRMQVMRMRDALGDCVRKRLKAESS